MEIYPTLQAKMTLLSFLLGMVAGALTDCFSLLCLRLKYRSFFQSFLRGMGDFFTVGTVCAGIIILSYYFNYGEIRLFAFVGVLAGVLAYKITLSKLICFVLKKIFLVLFRTIAFFLPPLRIFLTFLLRKIKKTAIYPAKVLEKIHRRVYNIINKRDANIKGVDTDTDTDIVDLE